MPYGNLYDANTRKSPIINQVGDLAVSERRRLGGSGFGSTIDTTYQYTSNVTGSGTTVASLGVMTAATGATSNSTTELITKYKLRAEFGKTNLFRAVARFQQTGAANNTTFIRIYVDANVEFGFRTNGAFAAGNTNFEIYYKKGGVITTIPNGTLNGNGTQTNQSISTLLGSTFDPTVFNTYEIRYFYANQIFYINGVAVHTLVPTSTILLTSLVGNMSIGSTNTGGSTTNVGIELIGWGGFQSSGVANNPLFYCNSGTAETRTLKAGGGTLHAIVFGAKGANGNLLSVYDNATGAGTLIIEFDLANVSVGSSATFNALGVNFYNGLTYISTGTTAKFTFLWE